MSRTTKSIKNSSIALIVNFLSLGINFFSRKIFLDYLGADILGLNSTAMSLLQFLNLAELGIGGAIAFTLYSPLFEGNKKNIAEIVLLQKYIYRKIGIFVLIGSIILMLFFPIIFDKIKLPLWYAYTSFGVYLFSSLIGYFVNYKQILLSADQREYVIQISLRISNVIKSIFQIVSMLFLNNPYLWWLIWELVFAICASVWLNARTNSLYPYLNDYSQSYIALKKKYNIVIIKVKQIFFHKLAAFALSQTSPIIIYAYTTLRVVTLYGNYMLIINGIGVMVNALFNGISAGIGNLVAEHNEDKIRKVFYELLSVRTLIASIMSFSTFFLMPDLITLWIGREYLLPETTLIILSIILFVTIYRNTIDSFLSAYGLFRDIWAPITEAILNISLSIIMGAIWGLNGILGGVLISLLIIVCIWKPYFLFRNGLNMSLKSYWLTLTKIILLGFVSGFITIIFSNLLQEPTNGFKYTFNALIIILFFTISMALLLFLIGDYGIKAFSERIIKLIMKK